MFVLKNEGRRKKEKKNWKKKKKNFFFADGLARPCHHRYGSCQPYGKIVVFFF